MVISKSAVLERAFPEGRALEAKPDFELRPTQVVLPKLGAARSRWSRKQLLIGAAGLLFLAAAADYGKYYWTTGRFLVSTDDAYVQAHSVLISPKVSGYISEVPVDDNQMVTAGQVLTRIDPRDYRTALDHARADVAAARASVDTLNRQIAEQKLVVEQDRQQVASDMAALVYSQQDFQRYTKGVKDGWALCSEPS
jgi:membrane fusion protein (multidrug efflux system)